MKPKDQILARMYVVLTLLAIIPAMVAIRLLDIHVRDGAELRKRGTTQASTYRVIPAVRGAIYDRAKQTLAVNTARYDLALDPTQDGFDRHAPKIYQSLANLTGRSAAHFRDGVKNRSSRQYLMVVRGLTKAQLAEVRRWDYPGVFVEPTFNRRYNYNTTLSHVLGHVNADGKGVDGLELWYDDVLRGVAGKRAHKRDRRGVVKAFVGGAEIQPRHGSALVLSVDLIQQTIVEEELARGAEESGAKWAAAIAMDPATGAILALANYPSYDSNRPAEYPSAHRRNHAVTDQIEPGSTFKLVPAIAALETAVVSLADSVETGKGYAVFGRRPMRDTHAHGTITFGEAIAVSSNIGVARVAERLQQRDLFQYARNLGFGQQTWVDLPGEASGRLKKTSAWSGTTVTSMSIGYEVDASPLQILVAYSALANGGLLMQPYVVAEQRDFAGNVTWRAQPQVVRRAFDAEVASKLIPVFEQVVETGTATAAQVPGLRIAGKTGTAKKVIDGKYADGKARATFVGFFPAEQPEVALIVVMDEPTTSIYGGIVAAPVFKRIAKRWASTSPSLRLDQAQADGPSTMNGDAIANEDSPTPKVSSRASESVIASNKLPDVAGKPIVVAAGLLNAAGYRVERPRRSAEHSIVVNAAVDGRRERVRLDVEEPVTERRMPDVGGLSARRALYWLTSHDVPVRVVGSGKVVRQTPEAGRPLAGEVVLVCE